MRNTKKWAVATLIVLTATLFACVNSIMDGNGEGKEITFTVSGMQEITHESMTRGEMNISELCTHLTIALYQKNVRVIKIDQNQDNEGFGTIATHLPYGEYTLVCVAHSSEGNATTTNLEKITFPSNYITDTFLYCKEITVSEDSENIQHLSLKRMVAKLELELTDKIPDDVHLVEIGYTGGSSTLSAPLGRGVVNSRQHEEFSVVPGSANCVFEVYTFPWDEEGELKVTVTAYDEDNNDVFSRVLENVPIKRNQITRYKGNLFGKGISGSITADSDWIHSSYEF